MDIIYTYSKHIYERMNDRNFTINEISSILDNKLNSVIIASDKDPDVDIHYAKIKNKYIALFVNRKTCVLITVRIMRRKERAFYKEQINGKNKIR